MSDKDQEQLKRLIRRAKELQIEEEKSMLRKRLEGQLLKFTNVVKGYQYRWCIVDPDSGTIEYYEKEEHKRSSKPRGTLNLTYASVCPSDEDSQAFVINAANGDFLKLKAADAKERQYWVNRIRAIAEFHSERAANNPLIATISEVGGNDSYVGRPNTYYGSTTTATPLAATRSSFTSATNRKPTPSEPWTALNPRPQTVLLPPTDAIVSDLDVFPVFCPGGSTDPRAQLRELFRQLEAETQALTNAVDAVSVRSPELTSVYKTLLLSKATTQATLSCLKRCLNVIKRRDVGNAESKSNFMWVNADDAGTCEPQTHSNVENNNPPDSSRSRCSSTGAGDESSVSSRSSGQLMGSGVFPSPILNMDSQAITLPELPADARPDPPFDESELGSVEEQKHIVLHLLSQLKLGMDLTKIVLPTFILEKRSLLEMFADYMAHPNLYIQITRAGDPESRMMAFVQWYLTTFHAGRKDKICKKPYNPIIGESFHCCWALDTAMADLDGSGALDGNSPQTSVGNCASSSNNEPILITYCAEQVSHHPPVTAFYFNCPAYKMQLSSSLHAKSKFQGMSVSVTMLGKTVLHLGEHNEEYHFAFPTAYARSILTVPWVELVDKVNITCPQTNYSATVTFHSKPMRSNKVHRITAEVFGPCNSSANVSNTQRSGSSNPPLIARVTGEWNGVLEFEKFTSGGKKWTIDTTQLPILPKLVRPIESQRPEESRRLWQHVTSALQAGNIRDATERKRELEERQRASEKYRVRHRIPFPVKYFEWNGSAWIFRNPDTLADSARPIDSIN